MREDETNLLTIEFAPKTRSELQIHNKKLDDVGKLVSESQPKIFVFSWHIG